MKTKSIWLWVLLLVTAISGCKYDDADLWNKVNSLDDRLTNIEEQLSQMNTNISSISTIVNAMDDNLFITSLEKTDNGYSIKFNNGETATLTNGKDGAAGKDAPVIGFDDFEGKYYWTQTIDGEQSWLTDEAGEKIPVTGADAVTPQLKVNTEGFWMISYDSGLTYTEMLDDAGNPVKAVGEDGKDGEDGVDGIDGSDGDDGDTWFSNVEVVEKDGNKVLVITFNGETFELPMQTDPVADLDKIALVTEGIGDWNKAYVTPEGYFAYRESAIEPVSRAGGLDEYDYLSYMSLDKSTKINILLSRDEKLPMQIIFEDKTSLYFSYLDNTTDAKTVLELVYDDGTEMKKVGGFTYEFAEWESLKATYSSKDVLIKALAYFNFFMDKSECELPSVAGLADTFADVVSLDISVDIDVDIILGLEKEDDGTFVFITDIDIIFEVVIEKQYDLALWTGEATFKVGGSSCTLKGSIWCASPIFNDYGVYGIVCDTDPAKLTLDASPEFSGTGTQIGEEFEVDFRGLKPNTTYYYRAYYKFNGTDHGGLTFVNAETSADNQIGYDMIIKEFTTGDNTLNVDVVMCMDVTGSMGGLISTVKRNALNFYDIFKAACDEASIGLTSLNTQVVAFRDKNVDGTSWLETSPVYAMPDNRDEFSEFVNSLRATGGGDAPESGLEALDVAFSKDDWGRDDGYHRQVVILWTDVPYLVGTSYTDLTVEGIQIKWDAMPSGRRLILFAPNGSTYNSGDWIELDSWTNVMHITDTAMGFEDMDYVIDNIIGELTGKGKASAPIMKAASNSLPVIFRPNN